MNRGFFAITSRRQVVWHIRTSVIGLLIGATFLLLLAGCPSNKPPAPRTAQVLPFIRGYVSTQVGGRQESAVVQGAASRMQDIYLPNIPVFLFDLSDKSKSQPVRTDLSGRFTLFPKQGRYRVCWEAKGFASDCSKDIYSVSNSPINIGTIRILVETAKGTTVVFGTVRLADGSQARVLQPLANINSFAQVELINHSGNKIFTADVNNFGDYLLPQVPVGQDITLRVRAENGQTDQLVRKEANLAGAAFQPINLQLKNHPPRLDPLVATDAAGRRVFDASPGTTVELKARASDADGDPLKFSWLVSQGSGTLSSTTADKVQWTLPNQEGLLSVTLIAYDGNGGYAQSTLSLRVDQKGIPFSGNVDSTAGGPVPSAEVDINGKKVMTDASGFFHVYIPDEDRFVFNIRKPGFALLSQVYERGMIGGRWTLHRATVISVEATRVITGTDQRRLGECPGPGTSLLSWHDYPFAAQPQWQDDNGNAISAYGKKLEVATPSERRPNKEKVCGPGIGVRIPANSLQDESGNPPRGKVDLALSTVDLLSPDQMPGDYTAQFRSGGPQVLQSYGAGGVEITASGHRYNLKPGAEAEVTIPVDPSQLAAGGPLPPTIPILFYDEKSGIWVEEGSATLAGNVYVAKVKHFSEINCGILKGGQACVDIQSPNLPPVYRLEITIPLGGGLAPKLIDREITNSPVTEHVAYNLPTNTNIVLTPYDPITKIPFGTFVVNTGGPRNPIVPNKLTGPPYSYDCGTKVILRRLALPEDPLFGEFLHGLFSFAATNLDELAPNLGPNIVLRQALDQASANYYAQVDPRGKRQTLGGFKCTNGLDGTEIRTFYANSGDLGFGRDMHCKTKWRLTDGAWWTDVACYVTNYGDITTPDSNDAVDAVYNNNPVATVAMEYSRIENPPSDPNEFTDPTQVVKFYVYNGNVDSSTLLRAANLDGKGARPVPQLCMVCHGGNYPGGATTGAPGFNSADDVKLGSVFLPFDLHNYTFAPPPNDKANAAVQLAFYELNWEIVEATNPGAAVTDILDNMYFGGLPQAENFVVSGWKSTPAKQNMYKTVVANSCRTCHAANPVVDLRFTDDSQLIATAMNPARLGSAENRVCTQHVMPHSKRTYDLFWQSISPHFPAEFQVFGDAEKTPTNGWQGDQCGAFTGVAQPPSPLYADAKGVFNNICAACHIGGTPPGGLNLQGDPYMSLFNVNACEPSSFTMKRIAPGGGASALSNSYLVQKINGTQAGHGTCNIATCGPTSNQTDCGGQMPLFGTLNASDAAKITNWVSGGAPR